MNAGLFLLALRRTLPVGLLLVTFVLVLAVASRSEDTTETFSLLRHPAALSGLPRQGAWILFSVFLLPLLLFRAAATIPRWREHDAHWLGCRGTGRPAVLCSTFLGTWVGGTLLLGVAALAAELGETQGVLPERLERTLSHGSAVLFDERSTATLTLDGVGATDLELETAILVHPATGPGSGPAADVVFDVGGAPEPFRCRIGDRTPIRLGIRGATHPLTLAITREGPGATVILPSDSIELLMRVPSARLASLGMLAREVLLLGAWVALALGLGAWTRGTIAALLILSLWILPWFFGTAVSWVPAGDLRTATSVLGDGLAPPPIAATSWLGCALAVALGLALAHRGLRDWRSLS